ncbi:MAG: hypothetical protein ACXADH_02610 [Candidatus Kariarchaeaceae archaeon]|jgi:hypothetical protein
MALELDFEICVAECCDQIEFCDTTCELNPLKPALCCDGYGALGNITKRDIAYTRFNWKFPDGTTFTDVDAQWQPAVTACANILYTAGTTGSTVVIIGNVFIGAATFTTTLEAMVIALVNDINSLSAQHGFTATYVEGVVPGTYDVTVCKTETGVQYNSLLVVVSGTGDIAATFDTVTSGGTNGSNCRVWLLTDLYGVDCPGPTYPNWPDGVYEITYILYDDQDNEIARKSKKFLVDCNAKRCVCELIKLVASGKCQCSTEEFDARLVKLRSKLDAAYIQFDECLHDCAQETVLEVGKQCENFCLDC